MKNKIPLLFVLGLLFSYGVAHAATTVTFSTSEVPTSVVSNGGVVTTEWAPYGITILNATRYIGTNDTFDNMGLDSSLPAPDPYTIGGAVLFSNPVSTVTVDWVDFYNGIVLQTWTKGGGYISAFVLTANPGVLQSGTSTFVTDPSFGYISRLDFFSFVHGVGPVGISTLTYEAAPVPEPGTMLLLGSGLAGLVGIGRRRLKK